MADAREAFGQDMEEPAPDELMGSEGEDAGFAGVAAGPVEQDVAVLVVADEALGRDGAALDVAGEVTQGGVAASDMLELDVPCFGGARRRVGRRA